MVARCESALAPVVLSWLWLLLPPQSAAADSIALVGVQQVDAGLGTTPYPDRVSTSLAFDGSGKPHLSYWRPLDSDLRYATTTGGAWTATTLDSGYWGQAGWHSDLELDASGRPWIVYNHQGGYVNYVRQTGAGWTSPTSVDPGILGGGEASLALGGGGAMALTYYNIGYSGSGSSWGMRYGSFTGTFFTPSEAVNTALAYYGYNSSLEIDSAGNPHVAYWRNQGPQGLYYAWKDGAGWHNQLIASGAVGQYVALVLDDLDHPHVAYWDQTLDRVLYLTHDGTQWSTPQVVATGAGAQVSMVLDPAGNPILSFQLGNGLGIAQRAGGTFSTAAAYAPAGQVVGESSSLAWRGDGTLWASFFDQTNSRILIGQVTTQSPVPEPGSLALMSLGILALSRLGRRRFRRT